PRRGPGPPCLPRIRSASLAIPRTSYDGVLLRLSRQAAKSYKVARLLGCLGGRLVGLLRAYRPLSGHVGFAPLAVRDRPGSGSIAHGVASARGGGAPWYWPRSAQAPRRFPSRTALP